RFNGRIAKLTRTTYFANETERETALKQYLRLYNHHMVQRNLGHQTPIQALKDWQRKQPELFNRRVYDHSGLDI
ncbi:MAG: IS481 family transposase, partial [Thiothrix sp.]|nr:IS481 family transposase [Thiothrix sp.]